MEKKPTLNKVPDVAQENASSYGERGSFTYQDYLQLPDEPGFRFEVLDGVLVKEPSPSRHHQRVCRRLLRVLDDYFAATDPEGEVFSAPLDVTLSDYTVVQPDLLYIPASTRDIQEETRVDGPPQLVVEILSPSNRRKDRLKKMGIYRKAGIPHYWIVDPEDQMIEGFALSGENYVLAAVAGEDETFTHPDFPGLAICLSEIWRRPSC